MTIYLITGYTKEVGVWEVELFRDYDEAVHHFKQHVEDYNAELDEDNTNFALCPDGVGRFWLEERTI